MIDRGSVRRAEVVSIYEILRSRRRETIALRILAALAVAFAHLDASLGLGEAIGVSFPGTELATLGLIIFFALSGALLSRSAADQSLGQFTKKRFLRIYPAFFVVMLVTTVFIVPVAWLREHQSSMDFSILRGMGYLNISWRSFTFPSHLPGRLPCWN